MYVFKCGYELIMLQIVNPFILCLLVHSCCIISSHDMQDGIFGDTALLSASSQGHIKCATVLLKHGADINYGNKVRLLYTCRVNMVQYYNVL